MTNQTARVLELLKRFNNGKKVCIEQLQREMLWEDKSEKTIRRDLDVIKLVFPESFELMRGEKGCYKALTNKAFENFLNSRNISLFVQTFNIDQRSNLFESLDIDVSDKALLEAKSKEFKKLYSFKNKPFENKTAEYKLLKQIESAIYHTKVIYVNYELDGKVEQYEIKPYKIIFMQENFYLSCEVLDENFLFTLFRISNVKEIINTSRTFHTNYEIEDFIEDIQTPFASYKQSYKKKLVDVVVNIDEKKARYFKAKKFLPSQKIVTKQNNGNIEVHFKVTDEHEMDDLIKRWIPYMKVVSPVSLKRRIEQQLLDYLSEVKV